MFPDLKEEHTTKTPNAQILVATDMNAFVIDLLKFHTVLLQNCRCFITIVEENGKYYVRRNN